MKDMVAILRAQPTIYEPAHIGATRYDGQQALEIEYAAPVPPGLLASSNY